jgi:serine/threonine protein kinase
MAEVWSARIIGTHPGEDRFFAIKLLASHLAERPEYRDMFLAEAQLSMMLSHANIVRVYDAVADERDCYMVMELISGMTLSQFQRAMQRGGEAIPLHISAFIIGELLRALSYAHSVQTEAGSVIVHRDVSPQNVMVTASGEIKLMDFGIARFASEETQGAFVKGKLQYMPPEQLRKQTRKPTVDLYAVGAIMHELVDGRRFRGKLDQGTLLQMVIKGEVPPLRQALPAQLEAVRAGLLEAEEDERIQTARKALGMLARWPDYRDANAELRELVKRFVEPNSVFEVPEGSKVSSVPEGSFSGIPSLYGAAASDSTLDAIQAAQTEPTGSELTAEDDHELPSVMMPAPVTRKKRLPVWPFAVGGVALALGIAGILYVAAQRQQGAAQTDTPPEPEPAQVVEQPTPPPPEPQPPPATSTGAPVVLDEAGSETGDDTGAETGDETGDMVEAGETDGADAAVLTVPVDFVANEFFFVYVRIGNKVLALEPKASTQVPVGTHTVSLRQSKDEKWQKAGRIKLEPDKQYRVEMRKPAGLKLVSK